MYSIIYAAIATLAFLQVTPAPPVLVAVGVSAATAQSVTTGAVAGTIAGGATVGATCGSGNCDRRRRRALSHAQKLAREIEAEVVARQEEVPPPPKAPEGVPQHNFDACYNDGLNAHVKISGPVGDNRIKIEGLPPSCMTLSTVLDGNTEGGPRPYPCGSACLEYGDMTQEEYDEIATTINAEIINA